MIRVRVARLPSASRDEWMLMCESTCIIRRVTLIDTLAATVHPGDSIRARRIELGWSQVLSAAAVEDARLS